MNRARWDTENKEHPLRASPGESDIWWYLKVSPVRLLFRLPALLRYSTCVTWPGSACKYRLFSPSVRPGRRNVGRALFHRWWCAPAAHEDCCGTKQREGATPSPDEACGLFYYVPLHNIRYGVL